MVLLIFQPACIPCVTMSFWDAQSSGQPDTLPGTRLPHNPLASPRIDVRNTIMLSLTPAPPTPSGRRSLGRTLLASGAATTLALGALLGTAGPATADPLPAGTTFDDGMVVVGENYEGDVGNGSLVGSAIPTSADYTGTVLEGETIAEFVTNSITQLVLTDDGTLISWGRGGAGQLGDGTTVALRSTAAVIDVTGTPLEGKEVTSIGMGWETAYALTSDGTVAAWGNNANGELGSGTTDDSSRPTAVDLTALGGAQVAALFPMYRGALVQTTDGSLFAWGNNRGEILVPGTPGPLLVATPIDISGSDLEGKIIDDLRWGATGGADRVANLILTTDGELLGWGEGSSGFIGQGDLDARAPKPTAVPALAGITISDLQAGSATNALALSDSGDVYSWGDNSFGALGDGTTTSSGTPTRLVLPAPATQIEAGLWTGFAILADGTVSAWGDPSSGTLGNGVSTDPQTPLPIPTTGTALAGRDVTALRSTNGTTIMFTEPEVVTPVSILTPADGSTVEPGFTITGAGEFGATVAITDAAGTDLGSFVIANTDGSWSFATDEALSAGGYTWTFTQDADASAAVLSFTIEAAPVITPVTITGPAAGSIVGLRPVLVGGGTPGAIVTIVDGGSTLGTATVASDGVWTFTPSADFTTGTHTVTATQDVDGSTASIVLTVVAVAPSPGPTDPTGPTDGRLSSTGADVAPMLLLGGLLAAAGTTAIVLGRRLRHRNV